MYYTHTTTTVREPRIPWRICMYRPCSPGYFPSRVSGLDSDTCRYSIQSVMICANKQRRRQGHHSKHTTRLTRGPVGEGITHRSRPSFCAPGGAWLDGARGSAIKVHEGGRKPGMPKALPTAPATYFWPKCAGHRRNQRESKMGQSAGKKNK